MAELPPLLHLGIMAGLLLGLVGVGEGLCSRRLCWPPAWGPICAPGPCRWGARSASAGGGGPDRRAVVQQHGAPAARLAVAGAAECDVHDAGPEHQPAADGERAGTSTAARVVVCRWRGWRAPGRWPDSQAGCWGWAVACSASGASLQFLARGRGMLAMALTLGGMAALAAQWFASRLDRVISGPRLAQILRGLTTLLACDSGRRATIALLPH